MANSLEITIKEDLKELERLKRLQQSLAKEKRVIALIRISKSKDKSRQALADHLGVNRKTLRLWIKEYHKGGIEAMLEIKPKRKESTIFTSEIHEALEKRVMDIHNSFKGYWDAQNWLKSEFGLDVKYQTVREHLIRHFDTKVKRPRRSHVKKDPEAVALFKNAT